MLSVEESAAAHRSALEEGRHLLSGFVATEVERPGADMVLELAVDDTVTGPAGALQGGLLATLADYVGGKLTARGLSEGELAVTSDLTVHYLAPVKTLAVAVGSVVKRGKRTVVVRVDVHDGHDGPVGAICTLQFAVVRPRLDRPVDR